MTIYVGNLPHEVTQDDLSNAFTDIDALDGAEWMGLHRLPSF